MKKALIVGLFLGIAGQVYAADVPRKIGSVDISSATYSGGLAPWPRTLAQLQSLTPKTTGQIVWCSNCTAGGSANGCVCVSSGSMAPYQWILTTGTKCQ